MPARRHIFQFLLAFALVLVGGGVALAFGLQGHGSSPTVHTTRSASTAAVAPTATVTATSATHPAAPVLTAGPAAAPAPAPRGWINPRGLTVAVERIADETGAQVGVAVRPLTGSAVTTAGSLQVGSGWSTMKVPVIMARYRLATAQGTSTSSFDSDVVNAITESDNSAVLALFNQIEAAKGGLVGASAYVQQGLRAAGDDTTEVNTATPPGGFSTFGQTQWSLSNGTLFYRALANGCLAPTSGARRVLTLMGEITPSQSWGLGQTHFPGVSQVFFKGGWGPAPPAGPYLVRQFGIVETPSGHGFVVGVMTVPRDGEFASGISVLNQLAQAVASHTNAAQAPAPSGC